MICRRHIECKRRQVRSPTLNVLKDAARVPIFWVLFGTFFVCGCSTNGLIQTHFITLCHDYGLPAVTAASVLAMIGIFDFFGTIGSGWLSDRFDNRWLLFWYYGLRGLSLLYLPFTDFTFYGLSAVSPVLRSRLDRHCTADRQTDGGRAGARLKLFALRKGISLATVSPSQQIDAHRSMPIADSIARNYIGRIKLPGGGLSWPCQHCRFSSGGTTRCFPSLIPSRSSGCVGSVKRAALRKAKRSSPPAKLVQDLSSSFPARSTSSGTNFHAKVSLSRTALANSWVNWPNWQGGRHLRTLFRRSRSKP
jgi:hypothetical protein